MDFLSSQSVQDGGDWDLTERPPDGGQRVSPVLSWTVSSTSDQPSSWGLGLKVLDGVPPENTRMCLQADPPEENRLQTQASRGRLSMEIPEVCTHL